MAESLLRARLKGLSIDELQLLEDGLIAKLIQVSHELAGRFDGVADLATSPRDSDDQRALLRAAAANQRALQALLEQWP